MSIAIAVKHLIAAGVTGDRLVEAIAEMEASMAPAQEKLPARQARNARYYESRKERLKASESVLKASEIKMDESVLKASENVLKRLKASYSDAKVSPASSPSSSSPPITPLITTPPSSPPSKIARDAAFARFWSAWPHKVGKPAAERAFGKVADEVDAIVAGVERYIRDKPPDRPWLNPATFLNQRRWEDAPAESSVVRMQPKERDLRNVPDALLSADDYWKKRRQQREWA